MGSPLWPPRTASCEMRMGPSCTGRAVTLRESYDATSSRTAAAFPYMTSTELCRDSPCWRWDNKRTALLHHTYIFLFLVSKFVDSVQEQFWTYWTGHTETCEAGEIMVIYCVTAGSGQIQLRLITLNQTTQKRGSLFAVFVNCVVHRMYSLVSFQEIISRTTNNNFCLLYFKLLLLILQRRCYHRPTDACVVDPKVHKK